MALLSLRGITVSFGGPALLDGVELSIERHHARKYRQIVEDLVRKLNELHPTVTVEQRMLISDICCWLAGRMEDR